MSWYITGFEPFGGHPYNPSAHVAEHAGKQLTARGKACHWEVIPVTFACARTFAMTREVPGSATLIHVGLAADRAHISLEQRAKNHHGTTLDNLGELPSEDLRLDPRGPDERVSALDLEALAHAIEQADEQGELPPVRITRDAGSYVCNAIYYHSLQHTPRSVFIHIPNWDAARAERFAHILARALLESSPQVLEYSK